MMRKDDEAGIITRESFQVMWAKIWNLYSTSFSNDRDPQINNSV